MERQPMLVDWKTSMADYTNPIKISANFFAEIWQADTEIQMESQGIQNSLNNLEKENKIGGLTLHNFKT